MRTEELDFHLPPELIAESPTTDRAASRLLQYRCDSRSIAHRRFSDLPSLLLRPGDVLVFNDARVTPARFMLRKRNTGGRVDALFIGQTSPAAWRVLLRNVGPAPEGLELEFAQAPEVHARVGRHVGEGEFEIEVRSDEPAPALLERIGRMPLPPYIKRDRERDDRDDFDREHYQTVFAKTPGSIAAPTAGLHFTPQVLEQIDATGVERAFVTLHVGLGTFKPVTSESVEGHDMHSEDYSLDATACDVLNRAKRERRRIVAVGTTATRVLESQPGDAPFEPRSGSTRIFIYPPYAWKHVGALITNFHLPRSTLVALVAALVGLDEQRRIYAEAIAERYRFFSYGDSSLLE